MKLESRRRYTSSGFNSIGFVYLSMNEVILDRKSEILIPLIWPTSDIFTAAGPAVSKSLPRQYLLKKLLIIFE